MAQDLVLYRYGKPRDPASFWTPDKSYIQHCKGRGPNHRATLRAGVRVRQMGGVARPRVIRYHLTRGNWDVLVFNAWDAEAKEYVVFNPSILALSRCRG